MGERDGCVRWVRGGCVRWVQVGDGVCEVSERGGCVRYEVCV